MAFDQSNKKYAHAMCKISRWSKSIAFLLLLVSGSVAASFRTAGNPFVASSTSQFVNLCFATPTANDGWGWPYVNGAPDNAVFQAGVIGTTFSIECTTYNPSLGYVELVGTADINIQPNCTVGAPSALAHLSTIASIDTYGHVVPATPAPNPQCQDGCVSQLDAPLTLLCQAFLDPTELKAVGAPVYSYCSGATSNIKLTGATCNVPDADFIAMADVLLKPLGFVAEDGSGAGTGTGTTTITASAGGRTSNGCTDTNGDGLDDQSKLSCSAAAETAIADIITTTTSAFGAVGTGTSVAGDVNALSDAYGGFWFLPDGIRNAFSQPAQCHLLFKLPELPFMRAAEIDTSGWCAVFNKIEPFLAFLVWAATTLFLFSLFRRV